MKPPHVPESLSIDGAQEGLQQTHPVRTARVSLVTIFSRALGLAGWHGCPGYQEGELTGAMEFQRHDDSSLEEISWSTTVLVVIIADLDSIPWHCSVCKIMTARLVTR